MRQLTIAKMKNYTLILLGISIVIIGSLFYLEKVENERQHKLFLNRFYAELHIIEVTNNSELLYN
ncbi:hypothetical protein [Paucisalibacillus globulus]|uniref:hypothetical protein n=1 Tax=Paucisalibacillus globulus TaxID=351095 RepID=UPI0004297A01|nr:hypothetical protein [Paucisalibacillus globulus]